MIELTHGDCLEEMKNIPDGSIDLVLTDPPYGLSFMGKKWDYDVPTVDIWQECLRVLKPGGYILAFAGTRTQHRMAVRIEDAGFEIRDMIMYVYGQGFPKSTNIYKQFQKMCTCGNMVEYDHERTAQESKHQLRPLQDSNIPKEVTNTTTEREVLQSGVSEQSVPTAILELSNNERREEPSLEGRSNVQTTTRELQGSEVCPLSTSVPSNGEEGRICDGAQIVSSTTPEHDTQAGTGSASQRPQPIKQFTGEPCAFCKQHGAQKIRARASEIYGFGSALKPACEPITVARKPLSEKNLAENVLRYGTGGLNIYGCRVGTTGARNNGNSKGTVGSNSIGVYGKAIKQDYNMGRFPANLIHDGSEEVVGLFPCTNPSKANARNTKRQGVAYGKYASTDLVVGHNDNGGSAARFFYCAKSSRKDRNAGLDGTCTVKYNTGICKEENMEVVHLLRKVTSELTLKWNIDESGANIMALCQQDSLSTTLTKIRQIIESKTYSLLKPSHTNDYTQDVNSETESGGNPVESAETSNQSSQNTTNEKTESALGVEAVVLRTLQVISVEESWKPMTNVHSTVKPIALMEYLVTLASREGATILDPFMGSGTTGIACKKLNRNFIGIELDEQYFEIAQKRIQS